MAASLPYLLRTDGFRALSIRIFSCGVKYNSAKKELKSYWLSREKRVYYYWYKRYVFSDLAEKLLDANNRQILEILRV